MKKTILEIIFFPEQFEVFFSHDTMYKKHFFLLLRMILINYKQTIFLFYARQNKKKEKLGKGKRKEKSLGYLNCDRSSSTWRFDITAVHHDL